MKQWSRNIAVVHNSIGSAMNIHLAVVLGFSIKEFGGLSPADSEQSTRVKLTLGAKQIRLSDLQCFNCIAVAGAILVS